MYPKGHDRALDAPVSAVDHDNPDSEAILAISNPEPSGAGASPPLLELGPVAGPDRDESTIPGTSISDPVCPGSDEISTQRLPGPSGLLGGGGQAQTLLDDELHRPSVPRSLPRPSQCAEAPARSVRCSHLAGSTHLSVHGGQIPEDLSRRHSKLGGDQWSGSRPEDRSSASRALRNLIEFRSDRDCFLRSRFRCPAVRPARIPSVSSSISKAASRRRRRTGQLLQ